MSLKEKLHRVDLAQYEKLGAAVRRIAELEAALRVAQPALRDALEAAVRKGTTSQWEQLATQAARAHSVVTAALG